MVNMEFYTYLNHKRNMDLPSQIHSFIVKRIYNITFLVKALLFALFVSLNSAYAQETTSYNLTNESNAGLLKRAELLIDTDVITSIELSKSLLSQAQSADDTLLSAKLHNLLGRANKKNNNINESLEHFLQSSVYYSKLNDSRNQIKASINYINILLEEKRYEELTTRIETLLPTTLVYGDDFFIAQVLLTKGDSFYEQKKYNNANAQYTSALKYLVDENPGKINTFSPGFHIPVYSSKKLKTDKPDIIVILAWRYKKQIIEKLKKMNLKTLVVTPIPKLEIIKIK